LLTFLAAIAEFTVVVLVALAAVLLKTIDGRGFLSSVVVGLAIIYGGGVQWFVVVAVFFILGVTFTLYEYGYKKKLGSAQEKGGARNWPNILANGGLPSLFAISQFFFPAPAFAALFLGSISTSAADTAATELGLLSRGLPRMITSPSRLVSPGTSGGVSTLGFTGAALASVVIGVMALVLGVIPLPVITPLAGALVLSLCAFGGVAGTIADSFLGALVQRKGYCPVCLRQTEALAHCGEMTRVTGGARFVENNVVNVLAALFGGVASLGFLVVSGLG